MREIPEYVRTLRCPVCGATFRAAVSAVWYHHEVRRTYGFPERVCGICLKLADAIRTGKSDDGEDNNAETGGERHD